MPDIEKIVIVTRKTWLEELIERFNTKEQAKFYIEHMGGSFGEYEAAHQVYYDSLEKLKRAIQPPLKYQVVERGFLPNFLFNPTDLVVVCGQDGLVVNAAKYLDEQRILAVNPDPQRIDGILLPFQVKEFPAQLSQVVSGSEKIVPVTMAQATLNNNQTLLGFNDLFIGHVSHQSARYSITFQNATERHSSSGIIISTGAGSTGWFRSIITGAVGIASQFRSLSLGKPEEYEYRVPWDASYLLFSVREPFESRTTRSNIVFGKILKGQTLKIESHMSEGGVIFSDGIEKDFVNFTSGTISTIAIASKRALLVVKEKERKED